MPKLFLRDCGVYINGIDQSNYVRGLAVEAEKEELDITGLSSAPYRETYPGVESLVFSFDMFWGNRLVDEALRDAHRDGTAVQVSITPHNTAVAPDNPAWAADCLVIEYQAFGDVGIPAPTSVTLKAEGVYTLYTLYPYSLTYPSATTYPA